MGKGNRNRIGRDDESVLTKKPAKSKKRRVKRPLPKLLVPIISLVVVIAIVVTAIMVSMFNNGTFKRWNVLVKSQESSKYSMNQQMAQILVWTSVWDQASQIYNYYSGLADSEFEYCWSQAMTAKYNIHEYIGDYYATTLTSIVAACDEGVRSGVEFTKLEQEEAYNNLLSSLKSEAYSYYSYLSEQGISSVSASYVYYSGNPYFGQFLRETLGKDIKEKDIRKAAIVQAYADKVYAQKATALWESADDTTIANEVSENLESYYSVDYLSYSTSSAALAAILKDATTADAFKSAIVTDYVSENYLASYNKYVTGITAQVNTALAAVTSKNTTEDLDTALTEQSMEKKTYSSANKDTDFAGDMSVVGDWLFPSDTSVTRSQFESVLLTSENKLHAYVVVISEIDSDAGTVTAAVKTFDYTELSAEDLAKLTNTVLKSLELPVDDSAAVYDSALDQANAIADQLKAENADQAAILSANNATTITGVAEETEAIPQDIRDALFVDGAATGDVLTAGNKTTVYVVVVNAMNEATDTTASTADISYITIEEKMDDVVSELVTALGSKVPTTQTAVYTTSLATRVSEALEELNAAEDKSAYMTEKGATSAANVTSSDHQSLPDEVANAVLADGVAADSVLTAEKADGYTKYIIYVSSVSDDGINASYLTFTTSAYQAWLFDSVNTETMTGSPAANSTLKVDPTGDATDYSVYMALTEISKDTEPVVRGGYLSYSTKEDAEDGLARLNGLSGYDLLTALSKLSSTATVSDSIAESSVEGELHDWFFTEDRTAGETAIVEVKNDDDTTSYYLVVFLKKLPAWESTARTNYSSDAASEWIEQIVSDGGYVISEKALKKVKNPKQPTTEAETTEETTTVAEETTTEATEETTTEATEETTTVAEETTTAA